MATLKFDGKSYVVDHAVKGTDYVHGYDAAGFITISIDGVSDFSVIEYDGEYMSPTDCITETCNATRFCGNELKTLDGRTVPIKTQHISATLLASSWVADSNAGFVQSVTISALSDIYKAKVHPAWPVNLSEKLALSEETPKVRACTRTGNVLTFECWEEAPALNIPVVVEVYV